jgi:hypothetical protein
VHDGEYPAGKKTLENRGAWYCGAYNIGFASNTRSAKSEDQTHSHSMLLVG